jgi:hypothetical protein
MTNATTILNLADSLVYNNRFANVKLSAEQLSAESFATWKTLVTELHKSAYKVYALCENNGLKAESTSVDKTEVFNAIRNILAVVGDINGHKVYANAETAIAVIGYAGKRANVDAPELQLVKSRISNARRELKTVMQFNSSNKEENIANITARITELEAEKTVLMGTADMCHKQPTKSSDSAFRLDVEHFFARVIAGQLAKTPEELEAEELARKEARKAAAKARKANKAENTTK